MNKITHEMLKAGHVNGEQISVWFYCRIQGGR